MSEEAKLLAHKERIDRVVAHIHENLDAPLDMEMLGEIACLSPHHWHRIYREIMGETASQTIRRRRLWRAAHQLLHSAKKIEEIASAAHYGSVAAFTRAFVSEYGSSPAQYRAKGMDRQMANIEKRSIDPIELIGMDHQGPHYEIGRTFDRLFAWAVTTEGMITPETKGIAVFFDNPTEKTTRRVDFSRCDPASCRNSARGRNQGLHNSRRTPCRCAAHRSLYGTRKNLCGTLQQLAARLRRSPQWQARFLKSI